MATPPANAPKYPNRSDEPFYRPERTITSETATFLQAATTITKQILTPTQTDPTKTARDPHPLAVIIPSQARIRIRITIVPRSRLLNHLRPSNVTLYLLLIKDRNPRNHPRKNAKDHSRADHDKPPEGHKPEPPDKSIPKETNSDKEPKNDANTEPGEEPEEEWYHHISPIERNEEYNKRSRIDTNDNFLDKYMPLV